MKKGKVSIIISNYNYGRFLRDAIESALSQTWIDKEIIVIDDGSTDDSFSIIKSFEDKIYPIFIKNGGQRRANNIGFSISSGDVIVFLDADDILLPDFVNTVMSEWNEGVSKIQVIARRINENGVVFGSFLPKVRSNISHKNIKYFNTKYLEYPSPPGSANAYSRVFLNKIFPLGEDCDYSTDSTCIAMAPYFGDVVNIKKHLVLYRMHGMNDSSMVHDDNVYSREVNRAIKRFSAIQRACDMSCENGPDYSALFRGSHLLQLRIASMRLTPELHPLPQDSLVRAFFNAIQLPFRNNCEGFPFRIMITVWAVLAIIVPDHLVRVLIKKRFGSISLPDGRYGLRKFLKSYFIKQNSVMVS